MSPAAVSSRVRSASRRSGSFALARISLLAGCALLGVRLGAADAPATAAAPAGAPTLEVAITTVHADVVSLSQPWWFNRLGASQPGGQIFALASDVIVTATGKPIDLSDPTRIPALVGQVSLRPDKRPRPIVLRVNAGQNLAVRFTNLIEPAATTPAPTSATSFHVAGLELGPPPALLGASGIGNDATWVGRNSDAFANSGTQRTYTYFARAEGTFYAYSAPADWNGQIQAGLFGTVVVEPAGAEYYRSQVTQADLALAVTSTQANGLPVINYQAVYPTGHARAGQPILRMTKARAGGGLDLIASDLTAIITGPRAGEFPANDPSPGFLPNPVLPSRRQPFREFAIMYHEIFAAQQAFPQFNQTNPLNGVLGNGTDSFAINYGAAGIGAEILANRLGVGPMGGKQSVDLKFEEFFLSSWANGDPAMVVDVPANNTTNLSTGGVLPPTPTGVPATGPVPQGEKATKAFYPDDPSNVYHSYMRDHVTMRLLHTGTQITHVHHLHAHQWLRSPNNDNSSYLDSQMIAPGSTYTLEIAFNGSGNLNETVGDSIFHCHFYPHFAGGMWGLWRVHDVFEYGTRLDDSGIPVYGAGVFNRALPDAEIAAGTPIPGLVPVPTLAMAPIPANVQIVPVAAGGSRVEVQPERIGSNGEAVYKNPGYPFFVPGVSGHRAPHPPLDFAWEESSPGKPKLDANGKKIPLDGGLPRHLVLDGKTVRELHTRWDFTKDFIAYDQNHKPVSGGLTAFELPEEGTAVERAAMAAHATRKHPTSTPEGKPGTFILNGHKPEHGAPFANPSVDLDGNLKVDLRRYQGAAVQTDVAMTKQGWHFPQQRMLALWQDVQPTLTGTRAPQPLFFRANSGETIEFWHTNLVPDYYELDDFQIRTPTDIIGQHIHLVKFDVLASDGAGNGWNYEDGTFSPDEVRGRIDAINLSGGLHAFDPKTQFQGARQRTLTAKAPPKEIGTAPAGQNWNGAQTTIQRWDADPIKNNAGEDRTLRTVFTHDHFGPSTHQQVGLYGGLLVEPAGSKWYDPVSGAQFGDAKIRSDGGPTSWQANIVTANPKDSYREFALEFGDFQLAYVAGSKPAPTIPTSALFTANLTAALSTGALPSALSGAFAGNGVTLNAGAVVQTDPTVSGGLRVANPVGPGLADYYQLTLVTNTTGTNYQVRPVSMSPGWSSPAHAINPPGVDPNNTQNGAPYPGIISGFPPPGTIALNYRGEPVPARVVDPATQQPAKATTQNPNWGDLAFGYASINRADPLVNVQPQPGTAISSGSPFTFPADLNPVNRLKVGPPSPSDMAKVQPTDPFTPMLRAYAGDRVQVRTLVGAHHNPHFFSIDGVKWLYEPGAANTGWRNHQPMGISEHFEMLFELPKAAATSATSLPFSDYLYNAEAGVDGPNGGAWGIMRSFKQSVDSLVALPNNKPAATVPATVAIAPPAGTPAAKIRKFNIVATSAQQALGGPLTYNARGQMTSSGLNAASTITNPTALIYFHAEDLENGVLKKDRSVEPLILRAAAGDWIEITLTNAFNPAAAPFTTLTTAGLPYSNGINTTTTLTPGNPNATPVQVVISAHAGLNPQVVGYDITKANGVNVGFNPTATVAPVPAGQPPQSITFYWYAGSVEVADGKLVTTPIEFGAINLNPADPVLQHTQGLVGALVIEPEGSTWVEDYDMKPRAAADPIVVGAKLTRAAATVIRADGTAFRDFVMITQDDLLLGWASRNPQLNETTGNAVNYGTEPISYRFAGGFPAPNQGATILDFSNGLSNSAVAGTDNPAQAKYDPQTPIYRAAPGSEVRFRMVHPASASAADGETLTIDGHVFQEEPFTRNSSVIGHNPLSQWFGTRGMHGARDRFDVVLASAGGRNKVPGDYLYRSTLNGDLTAGVWGVFRVGPEPTAQAPTLAVARPPLRAAAAPAVVGKAPETNVAQRKYNLRELLKRPVPAPRP